MNSDDFEKRLQRQTIRPIPGEWRREILQQAKSALPLPIKSQSSTFKTFLSELLWPCPRAWAGMAAVWLFILTIHFSTHEPEPGTAKSSLSQAESMVAMKEQRRLYLELADLNPTEIAPPPPFIPRPRSERRNESRIV